MTRKDLPCMPARAVRFWRDERGSMTVFGLFTFLLMMVVGGMAVDMMRHETSRSRLQATLDRAVLAAGDLDVEARDAEAVVRSHFAAAGLTEELTGVTVTSGLGERTVSAQAAFGIDTHFMSLVGVDDLAGVAAGTATESIESIEIVLVLDVSGSMVANGSPRLARLRTAAHDFITDVLASDTRGRISIGIVPFNGQVNLGAALRSQYNVTDVVTTPANVNCVDLPGSVYAQQTISQVSAMPATAYVDTFSATYTSGNAYAAWGPETTAPASTNGRANPANMWCPSSAGNVVTLPTRDGAALHRAVDALEGIGATSINAGMRWGMTLIDPNARPMFSALVASGHIPADLAGRPFDYRQANTVKYLILMTDGEHFAEERVNDGFRSGLSRIWRSAADGNFSILHPSRVDGASPSTIAASRPFWVPHLSQWHARPWNGTAPPSGMPYTEGPPERRTDTDGDGDCDALDQPLQGPLASTEACWFDAVELTWPQVWSRLRMKWVAFQLYARPLCGGCLSQYNATMAAFRTQTAPGTMDSQLQQMCTRARDAGVTVYGIAFEAPPAGQAQIRACSPSFYYPATGDELRAVFAGIAAHITSLRLIR